MSRNMEVKKGTTDTLPRTLYGVRMMENPCMNLRLDRIPSSRASPGHQMLGHRDGEATHASGGGAGAHLAGARPSSLPCFCRPEQLSFGVRLDRKLTDLGQWTLDRPVIQEPAGRSLAQLHMDALSCATHAPALSDHPTAGMLPDDADPTDRPVGEDHCPSLKPAS